MIDQNAYRNPKYPLEPLFRALFTVNSDFDLASIDLVTDRNNLRKLLRFISNEDDKPFIIAVQRLGTTTLFTRTEERTSEYVTSFRGFGHEFEKAYTKWPSGMENSTGHHRIVKYRFGGLRCVVRFEVDASTAAAAGTVGDGLSSLLNEISIENVAKVCDSSTFQVTKFGRLVPQSSVLEIKTRAASRTLNMADVLPQLWFSATPSLIVGYHRGGRFNDVKTARMDTGDLDVWERSNVVGLRKLVALIGVIIKEAESAEGGQCVVQGLGDGRLRIVKTGAKDSLPEDLKAKFY